MAIKRLRVMISSRCTDLFPAEGASLTKLRRDIKQQLEAEQLLGQQAFDVWINEDAPPADTSGDSVAVCLGQVDEADILIVLVNGNAGWATTDADIGICHAELQRGTAVSPAKVRLVALAPFVTAKAGSAQAVRDERFQAYLETQGYFRGGSVKSAADAITRVKEAAYDATISLAQLGLREARKGNFSLGEALAWSSLSFAARQQQISTTLVDAIAGRTKGSATGNQIVAKIGGVPILFVVHAIPAALSVPAARELIGRPFLADHQLADQLKGAGGPVHIIGCHKGATEAQASTLLGFPDATIIKTPFGVYVADPVQKTQFVFLSDCRDPSSTRFAVQRLFDWLAQSGEEPALVARATSRAKIATAVAQEFLRG